MTTEAKIREVFEKKSGTPFKNMDVYQENEYCYFRAGYLALLNELRPWNSRSVVYATYILPEGVEK